MLVIWSHVEFGSRAICFKNSPPNQVKLHVRNVSQAHTPPPHPHPPPQPRFGGFAASSEACLLTTEHLKSLGRVEKRTLFVKPIAEVFRNEYVLANVLRTAEKAVAKNEPFLVTHMSQEDKWHVLTTCTNHLSSCFAPYHVFFNEARRVESYYQSAWYVFTLTCAQTEASGRWFITPLKPVGKNDVGMLRIRILMMNEQELRDISSGAIEPPSFGFFNGRHESRWTTCQRFAELFGRQLTRVAGTDDVGGAEWGPNLCGRLSNSKRLGLSYAELSSGKALGFWFGLVWLLSLSFPEALGFWFCLVWFGC
ncbi:unnamed protein product [Effrenium voratum]|nr:unnamed protein product [Effrenium voratum]